jgi:hypothetical protein
MNAEGTEIILQARQENVGLWIGHFRRDSRRPECIVEGLLSAIPDHMDGLAGSASE